MPRSREALVEDEESQLLQLLQGGAPLGAALRHIGREPASFCAWLAKPGQKALRVRIGRATTQANLADIATINTEGSWQSAKAAVEIRTLSERELELHEINALALGT